MCVILICVLECDLYYSCAMYATYLYTSTYLYIYTSIGGDADGHRLPSGAADLRQGRDRLRGGLVNE